VTRCGNCDAPLWSDQVCQNGEWAIVYRCGRCDFESTFEKGSSRLLRCEPTRVEGE
jgi:hypothetical protein